MKPYRKFEDILILLRRKVIGLRRSGILRLPGERELAEEFGAARPTVAKAIRRMEELGMLRIAQSGTMILPFKQKSRVGYLAAVHSLNGVFWYPAYERLWHLLEKTAFSLGFEIELFRLDGDDGPLAVERLIARSKGVDLMFMSLSGGVDIVDIARKMEQQHGVKSFFLCENNEAPDFPLYCLGNYATGELAAQLLLDAGYRHPAMIAPFTNVSTVDFFRRIEGFSETIRKQRLQTLLFSSYLCATMEELALMQKCIESLPSRGFDSAFFLCDSWIGLADNLIESGKTPNFGILTLDGTMKGRSHCPPVDTLSHASVPVCKQIISVIERHELGCFIYHRNEHIRFAPVYCPGKTMRHLQAGKHIN